MSESVTGPAELRDRFEKPEGYAGFGLCDPLGQKVGSVKQLFVNPRGEPEYIRVRIGLLGLRSILLSVESVTIDQERQALFLKWDIRCAGVSQIKNKADQAFQQRAVTLRCRRPVTEGMS